MFLFDDDENDVLTDEDQAALAAEERGETYEPEPEAPPRLVEANHEELERELAAERERFWRAPMNAANQPKRSLRQAASRDRRSRPADSANDPTPTTTQIGADLWEHASRAKKYCASGWRGSSGRPSEGASLPSISSPTRRR